MKTACIKCGIDIEIDGDTAKEIEKGAVEQICSECEQFVDEDTDWR